MNMLAGFNIIKQFGSLVIKFCLFDSWFDCSRRRRSWSSTPHGRWLFL